MAKKIALVVVALILVIGVSVGTTLLMDKTAVPASTTIENGLSAYELAVQYGYEGTVQKWLESLNGKSAYEIAVDNGYSGTEDEWSAAVNAAATQSAVSITTAKFSSKGELIIALSDGTELNVGKAVGADGKNGTDGKDGTNGKDGANGEKGADGISITTASINKNGQLVISFSDGMNVNLDKVVGTNGKDGVGVTKSEINSNGELVLTYSNGQQANLGVIIGANNDKDDSVVDRKDGTVIASATINSTGELVIIYSDGSTDNLGVVVGRDGINGQDGVNGTDGKDGQNGINGKDGISVTGAEITSSGELVLTYSNNQRSNLGKVIGANGKDGQDGADGKDGISVSKSEINGKGELVITYSDNTVENLGVVVGTDGKDGSNGKNGANGINGVDGIGIETIVINNSDELVITLSNNSTLNLGCIKGTDGQNGVNGTDGKDGISIIGANINSANELVLTFSDDTERNLGVVVGDNGKDGVDGDVGKDGVGIKKTEVNALGELVITYTDDTTDNLGVIASDNSGAGTSTNTPRVQINPTTNEWEISTDGGKTYISTGIKATGKDGQNGEDGTDGISIIDAVINENNELILCFSDNTEKNLGVVVGANGQDGKDGANGKDGVNGTDGTDGVGVSGAEIDDNDHLIIKLSNNATIDVGVVVGADGKDGINGTNGTNGKDGVGIKNVTVSAEGILTVTLDNDTILTLGNIKGEDGVGIAKTEIDSEGKLVITYTDDKVVTLDKVVGENGIGIKKAELTSQYMLKLTLSDDSAQIVGPIRGEKGADGVGIKNISVGDDGYLYVTFDNSDEAQKIAYIKGDPGVDGKTPYIKNGNWWIGDTDTGIKAEGTDGENGTNGTNGENGKDGTNGKDGKDGVGVVNSYIDDNYHLWIVLSDGTKIDAGYVGVEVPSTPTAKLTVVFKDYDGTVLKTQEVNSGDSATAPADPFRDGYVFAGWDKDYSKITIDTVITATYTKISDPTIKVSNVSATAGQTIQVPVVIMNNPGVAGATITISYDSALTLSTASNGEAFSALQYSNPGKFVSPCNFTWDSESGETSADGTIVYLTFVMPSTAKSGDVFEIDCSYRDGDIFNDAWDDVDLEVMGGKITVK